MHTAGFTLTTSAKSGAVLVKYRIVLFLCGASHRHKSPRPLAPGTKTMLCYGLTIDHSPTAAPLPRVSL